MACNWYAHILWITLYISVNGCVVPGWCSGSPGRGSAGWTHTLFLEKMISPSSMVRDPPVPTVNIKRSEALEDARRRSRPNDISSDRSLLPSSETETTRQPPIRRRLTLLNNQIYNSHLPNNKYNTMKMISKSEYHKLHLISEAATSGGHICQPHTSLRQFHLRKATVIKLI